MMLEAAPTPCRRTGFHISSSSEWAALVCVAPAVVQATGPAGRGAGRVDHEQVARVGCVDCGLDAGRSGYVGWRLAADGDGDRVNGLLAIGCGDDQFDRTALVAAAILQLLLDGAGRERPWAQRR